MKRLWLLIVPLLFLALFILRGPVLTGLADHLIVNDTIKPADVIIVLSGDDNGERVAEAVKLYREGRAPKIIMSGGPLAWRLTAAEWMKKQAVYEGVPASAILLQDRSRSTIDDAQFTKGLLKGLGAKSVILVTSPTHTRRAKMVFQKNLAGSGIKVAVRPVRQSEFDRQGWWRRHQDTQWVIWEYVSLAYYFMKGYN